MDSPAGQSPERGIFKNIVYTATGNHAFTGYYPAHAPIIFAVQIPPFVRAEQAILITPECFYMIVAKEFYLLRAPLLPVSFLEQFNGVPHAQLEDLLKDLFVSKALQEAIYLASPELFGEMQKWLQGNLMEKKDVNKLVVSLFRYLLRMSTRCTPYGLFAGCSVGGFGDTTRVSIGEAGRHKRQSRLDMNYVAELASMIGQLPEVREQVCYYPNSSLYKVGNRYRYAEYATRDKYRTYNLTSIDCSVYLEKILHKAVRGAIAGELAEAIVSDDISRQEASEFVNELIDQQVLVSELEPTVTGGDFMVRLIEKLQALKNSTGVTEKLVQIHQVLQHAQGIEAYLQTHALVKELLPDTHSKDLVQTDLFLETTHNTIGSAAIGCIQAQMEKLWCLARLNNSPDLQNFRQAFTERYDAQEVPLELALDTETGLGYAAYTSGQAAYTPLVDDIVTGQANLLHTVSWTRMQEFQLKRVHACLLENNVEIELTDTDLSELKEPATPSIPDSFYLMGSILGSSAEAVDAGDFRFDLKICGGPSAATLFGRFCPGDPKLLSGVKACLREEENNDPDCIYAEVVHLPQARTGNILLRPQLRDHEIVYLGNGSVAPENQIFLSDLMVSVQHDTVILRSKKLNKRVIPRLSSAHNFRGGSLPAYQFLCDLQFQQLHSAIGWQWTVLNDAPFLPRVRYKNILLSKCTWVLQAKDFPVLADHKKQPDRFNYLQWIAAVRGKFQLPQYVVLVEGDNELFTDLNNESCLHILVDTLEKKQRVVLQEFLGTADRCFAEGRLGKFTNEIIVPFTKSKNQPANQPVDMQTPSREIKNEYTPRANEKVVRSFITGSEWLYVKIYCGTNSAERILKEDIKPLVAAMMKEDVIDKWFFIRYADPGAHIRIRFHHATNKDFWKVVLDKLYAGIKRRVDDGLVYKIQTDTYNREIERYGAGFIGMMEDIFHYDSEAVLDCIAMLGDDEGESYRWLLASRGVDMLLDDFGYSSPSKAALLKKLQQASFAEFGGDKNLQARLNDKYREQMRLLDSFLDQAKDAENEIEDAVAVFSARSANVKKRIKAVRRSLEPGEETTCFDQLLPHYIHMFLNRMLLADQRKHELVIYHFLSKYYDSQMARQKLQQRATAGAVAIVQ